MFFASNIQALSLLSMLSAIAPVVNGYPGRVVERAAVQTANWGNLVTWWQTGAVNNSKTAVANGAVRQSHLYTVQVANTTAPNNFYDSFVYNSIPRNGNGNICDPTQPGVLCPSDQQDDQITIEPDIGVDMSWTQYLAQADSIVKVTRWDGGSTDPSNVVIRPTTLGFKLTKSGNSLLITVPYSANGQRFSVEFKDNLWTYRNAGGGNESHYVQNKNPSGVAYVSSYTSDMPIVGVEPLNALLIFVSPFPSSQYLPSLTSAYTVKPGQISGLDQVSQSVVYFPPGVYWATGTAEIVLSSSVTWVHIAAGAYVKGAIKYTSSSLDLRATGFGVVSGEQYVYQANTQDSYKNDKDNTNSVKMWAGNAATGAKWTLHGLTLANPPFNSMDFEGDLDHFSVDVSDYKQVGAFFGQTDGIEMYPNSHVRDVFYHVGDDAIKTYYSNVLCERMLVWKTNNAPIVQFGWYQRNINNITVDSVNVIHTRYNGQGTYWPRTLVASASVYNNQPSTSDADVTMDLHDYTISNWRCEGICPGLLGINPLENIDNMKFTNIWIEQFSPNTTQVGTSTFRKFTDASHNNQPVALGNNSPNNLGLVITNFMVGSTRVTMKAGNWEYANPNLALDVGRLNIDPYYWGRWTVQ